MTNFCFILKHQQDLLYFLNSSDGKASTSKARILGLILGLGRYHGEGNGNPLQYSCLENSMDRGAWLTTVHGVTKSQTQLSDQEQMVSLAIICHHTE